MNPAMYGAIAASNAAFSSSSGSEEAVNQTVNATSQASTLGEPMGFVPLTVLVFFALILIVAVQIQRDIE